MLQVRYCLDNDNKFDVSAFMFKYMLVCAGISHLLDLLSNSCMQTIKWFPEWLAWTRPLCRFLRRDNYRLKAQDRLNTGEGTYYKNAMDA